MLGASGVAVLNAAVGEDATRWWGGRKAGISAKIGFHHVSPATRRCRFKMLQDASRTTSAMSSSAYPVYPLSFCNLPMLTREIPFLWPVSACFCWCNSKNTASTVGFPSGSSMWLAVPSLIWRAEELKSGGKVCNYSKRCADQAKNDLWPRSKTCHILSHLANQVVMWRDHEAMRNNWG